MGPKIKTKTIYAKVLDRKIVVVEISIHSECIQRGQSSKENKANISKMFAKEHFDRLILKLQDVILAKVLAPSETVDKKKNAKTSCCDNAETLPDPELSIQYQFVRKRNYKQTALIRQTQESVVDGLRKKSQQCGYSGGGYQSYNFFPQKLNVTVSLTSQVPHQMPSLAGVAQDAKDQPPAPSKSTISEYFNKDSDTLVTRSTQKKRTALKNMNKKNCDESQKRIDSLLCSNSSVCEEVDLKETKTGKATSSVEPVSDTQHKLDKISLVNEHGNKVKIEDVLPFQEGVSSMIKDEPDNDILSRHEDKSEHAANDSSENSSITSGFPPKGEEFKANLSNEDVDSDRSGFSVKKEEFKPSNEDVEARKQIKTCENVSSSKDLDAKSTESATGTFKRRRFHESESDSTDADSIPALRLRLSKKTTLKKPKTVPCEETEGERKETDSISARTGDDNDFESPKARRNTGKRKGSDLSDDQDLLNSVFSTSSETAPCSSRDAKEGLNSRKRKTKKTDTKGDVTKRMIKNQPKKRIYKRKVRDTAKTTADALEDAGEEPGSSPLEPITIEDKPPMTIDVSAIEELTAEQTEYLVLEHASKLREIFEGKKYCRRHEDYKKGGKMKGDLAFQVQFGPFSEAQRDRIMEVLTNMFCYKHSKYFDYVSKVLLPETLVMLYMKVEGKTREEAELLLLEAPTSTT